MRVYCTLLRKELGAYFISLTGYVIIAAILALAGGSFLEMVEAMNSESVPMPLTELFFGTSFFWVILLVATPVITMRLYAQEKASGTFETLMTAPVGDGVVVLAKFTAALAFYGLAWAPLLACLLVVHRYTSPGVPFDWWPTASTFLGIGVVGASYVAMGCLASAMTRSQIIAATVSFAGGFALFLLSFLKFSVGAQTGWQAHVVNYLSLFDHFEDFVRGVVDTRHLAVHASLTAGLLFLTLKVVESRRWK
ncbi:MAG TPA: ABC transporter permease [Verrucomicrobiota bacterium]|nr:ABC transporter permease [Verrucomicrobiota bacterium]HNU49314.1 ABC transporter permease [Verrucomicrobiota bacterium]